MQAWPEPVERVAAFLRSAGAEARLEELTADGATAEAAADAIGCTLAQIVKSVLFVCDDAPVVVLAPGDRRIDSGAVARLLDASRARVARPEEVVAATGFAPGAVAPYPLPVTVREVLVERTLLRHPTVWTGGGSSRHLVRVAPAELVRLTRGRVEDVVRPSA